MKFSVHRAPIETGLTGLHPITELPDDASLLGAVLTPQGEVVIFYLLPIKKDIKEKK